MPALFSGLGYGADAPPSATPLEDVDRLVVTLDVGELLYVPSDHSEEDALARAQSLQCATIRYDMAAALKWQYKVWSGSEVDVLGKARRSGVPAISVITPRMEELAFVDAEASGPKALKKWDLQKGVF